MEKHDLSTSQMEIITKWKKKGDMTQICLKVFQDRKVGLPMKTAKINVITCKIWSNYRTKNQTTKWSYLEAANVRELTCAFNIKIETA